jgi:hypothetical protein
MRKGNSNHRFSLHQSFKDGVWAAMRDHQGRELDEVELRGILCYQRIAREVSKHPWIEAAAQRDYQLQIKFLACFGD